MELEQIGMSLRKAWHLEHGSCPAYPLEVSITSGNGNKMTGYATDVDSIEFVRTGDEYEQPLFYKAVDAKGREVSVILNDGCAVCGNKGTVN